MPMNKRQTLTIPLMAGALPVVKNKVLNWLRSFSTFSYYDNNGYVQTPNRFELLVGAGSSFRQLHMPAHNDDWWFGHYAYDYKNELYRDLYSRHEATSGFGACSFYCPQIVLYIPFGKEELVIETLDHDPCQVWAEVQQQPDHFSDVAQDIGWEYSFKKEEYLTTVTAIKEHLAAGDCYELNLCAAAGAYPLSFSPHDAFYKLNQINPAPFAALYRNEDAYLISASPERFLYRSGRKISTQPIKGTARRGDGMAEDKLMKSALYQNEKERAEHVMIVDLMRNDLARSCESGSIEVPELFGIYTFPQVHQIISTIQGTLRADSTNDEIFNLTFPMGSMTGAPKKIVMQLIDNYEQSRRELYSGTVGYVTPRGDFDFNVVIRSLFFHAASGYLSYQAGGAITFDSDPESEWEELRLKARSMELLFL